MILNYPKFWQRRSFLAYLLLPIAGIFYLIIKLRYFLYHSHFFKSTKFSVPVIIVGNITVGGTGKTPFVIWLAEHLQQQGKKPGIVSRGYGSKAPYYPYAVRPDSDYCEVGDEALVIVRRTKCPMVIGANRVAAVQKLLATTDCDVVISDDGLQHYALGREQEIVLVDGDRRFGNGFLLPAGPLREPISRLKSVNQVIINGVDMHIIPAKKLYPICFNNPSYRGLTAVSISEFIGKTVHAVAGIGNPQKFFTLLENIGIKVIPHPFPDHNQFIAQDLNFDDDLPIIMTEKDAVKCERFELKNCWYLPVKIKKHQ
jgi:tetraacyldisaccharide 4'-kinase